MCVSVALSLCLGLMLIGHSRCFGTEITHTYTSGNATRFSTNYKVLAQKCQTQLCTLVKWVWWVRQTQTPVLSTVLDCNTVLLRLSQMVYIRGRLCGFNYPSGYRACYRPGFLYECMWRAQKKNIIIIKKININKWHGHIELAATTRMYSNCW